MGLVTLRKRAKYYGGRPAPDIDCNADLATCEDRGPGVWWVPCRRSARDLRPPLLFLCRDTKTALRADNRSEARNSEPENSGWAMVIFPARFGPGIFESSLAAWEAARRSGIAAREL